ncbi:SBA1 [Candida theae]|uniref:SBA1 n=1 Tax=Candida theae TaxID=1198502 RepID=A0AAD5BJ21_9ASCO|nr:SBA1 [Candida theae]KAI5967498.1 SBA1 [Candida theae]
MSSKTHTPTVLWAQRSSDSDADKNVILLTVQITDPKDLHIDLKPTYLTVKADSSTYESTHYELKIDFYDEIDPEKSKINTENGSHLFFVLSKKKLQEEYWPRLTKEKLKYHYIKTDFDKWVDEDEQDEVKDDDANLMGGMPGMGGAGGPGGMDFSQLLGGMGGGAGGTPDLSALASQLGQAGGAGGAGGPGGFDFSSLQSDIGNDGDVDDGEVDSSEVQVDEEKDAK